MVIPVYRPAYSDPEGVSLRLTLSALRSRRIVFVSPEGLDMSAYTALAPDAEIERFDPAYFKGIAGYNRLMMSAEFYSRFTDYEFILISQPDAIAFTDDLDRWCAAGYDYVGAPWLVRPIYRLWPLRAGSWIKHTCRRIAGKPDARRTWWKVGNGGFSLRRVESHLRAVTRLRPTITEFLSHPGNHLYNEDVFFSTEVNRHGLGFRYPGWREALTFAFDKYPSLCYRLNGNRLPMGCHAWFKRRMRKFWTPIVESHEKSLNI